MSPNAGMWNDWRTGVREKGRNMNQDESHDSGWKPRIRIKAVRPDKTGQGDIAEAMAMLQHGFDVDLF